MKANRPLTAGLLVLVVVLSVLLLPAAWGINLGSLVKVGGIALLVSTYGGEINGFLDKSLGEREAAAQGATKVVPILSLGGGGYIGAAQVVGNPDNVKKVRAVIQVEGRFGKFGARVLVPTATEKALANPQRAKGVGVSAVVEFKI
jgi:hypothetical protein